MADKNEMIVRIVSVDTEADIAKKDGGTYPGAEVTYKTQDGKTMTKGIHKNTFRYNKALLESLKQLEKGDYVRVTLEKQGDFVNWTTVEKTERPAEPEEKPEVDNSKLSKPQPKAFEDNRETREERATRQRLIVRQSSLTAALGLLALQNKTGEYKPTTDDVIELAIEFEQYVFGEDIPEAGVFGDDDVAQPD